MTLYGFLIDENLSPHLKRALSPHQATHTRDLGESLSDSQVWQHATEHCLVVLTKDADFVDRMLVAHLEYSPLAVIRLHCGNLRAAAMRQFLEEHLGEVLSLLGQYRLIHLYPDHIEAS